MIKHYILVGQTPVPCEDTLAWVQWFHTHDRRVRVTQVGPYEVSTVFLGLDHRHSGEGPPLLFETVAFGCDDLRCEHCSTWLEAETQHERVVEGLRRPGYEVVQLEPVPL